MQTPTPTDNPTLEYAPRRRRVWAGRDDLAYLAPMLVFMTFTWLGGYANGKYDWWPKAYAASYVTKTVVVAALLWLLWPNFTKICWNHWWLGVIVGVVGIFQWVPMQLWLQRFDFFHPPPAAEVFNPYRDLPAGATVWAFIAVRIVGATLVVPVMEELFWRDFLWRQILAPNDFKLARVGEWGWAPFLGVSVAFAVVHGNWWLTSIVWALMIAGLLVYTKSLGACIVAHAVTNLLLAAYVLKWKDWAFW